MHIFQLGECQLLVSWAVHVQSDGLNSALSNVLYGDIALSINTQYNVWVGHTKTRSPKIGTVSHWRPLDVHIFLY